MSTLHLIGGEKGGVGKSVVARILAQYFIDRGLPFTGYDSDKSHGALLRFYAGYASPVVIDDYANLDRVVEAAAANPDQRILLDLAAQTHHSLSRWMDDSGLIELAPEVGLRITYWHVMDAGRDSVDLLRTLLDGFGSRVQLVMVLNALRGDGFTILDASGEKTRAEQGGARVLRIGHLNDATMQKIDARDTSFWAAIQPVSAGGADLGLLERQRVKVWLSRVYEQIDGLAV
ncbi:MAG: mobilization protein [Burkholderiales bacterium]